MASKKYNGERTVVSTNGVAVTVYPYGKNIEPESLLYTIGKNLSKMNHRSKASRKIKIGKCLHSLSKHRVLRQDSNSNDHKRKILIKWTSSNEKLFLIKIYHSENE